MAAGCSRVHTHCLLVPADGIRAIAKQEEPVGRLLSRLEVAEGLVLDKVRAGVDRHDMGVCRV